MLEVIYSLIFIEFLGILIFPIIFTVFWKLPDRGYSFSKLLSSQALGDRLALALNARKVMHIDIGSNLLSLEDLN